MEPIEAGTSWTLPDGRKRSIAGLASPVTTPLGNYSAVEVVTTGEGYENRDYYAKGVGLVKSVFSSSDMEVSSSLAKIEENTPFAQSVRFFFPDSDGNIYYVEKEISFKTNDITRQSWRRPIRRQSRQFCSRFNSRHKNQQPVSQ
jgi:hypothetical protein